jgi:alpha-1,3-mannosyltransferase
MSSLQRAAGLPRGLTRLLIAVSLAGALIFLIHLSRGEVEEGIWDASSYSDRRGNTPHNIGGIGAVKKRISAITNPEPDHPPVPPVFTGQAPHPNPARKNYTLPRPTHKGFSRKAVLGAPDKYTTAPLPTIEEAWEWLHPRLREIKRKVPSIPREHALWNPLFNPSLTEEMKLRYTHLRMDWDEEKEEWVPADRRYLLVTICRQVAGESRRLSLRLLSPLPHHALANAPLTPGMLADWFAAWTVLADYLGPESLVFSLQEGDSADGT